jgi:outer membrane protein assembly factor BamB
VPNSSPQARLRDPAARAGLGRRLALIALALVAVAGGCGGASQSPGSWRLANGDLSATRAATARIDGDNVADLRVRWRFRLTGEPTFSGLVASNPLVEGDTVYAVDLQSTVVALNRPTGTVRWSRRYRAPNSGPNGLALGGGRLFGATDSDAFALDAASGRELWRRHLTSAAEPFVEVAPVVADGRLYISTVGRIPGGRGAVYALDPATGAVKWKFVTVPRPWKFPLEAGGGGLWYPVNVDANGRVYGGNSNPLPWGGVPGRPNGGSYPGPALYTDSLLVFDGRTGRLVWYDQVTPHDVRDYDFQASPILATLDIDGNETDVVFGAGKAGRVIAWNRETRERLWEAKVGLHLNDTGPLPRRRVTVCPGLFGGVETPMAYDDGRLFVPVVDLCMQGSAVGYEPLDEVDPERGGGRLVALDAATGRRLWERRFPSPVFGCATVSNDVVFTSTFDGRLYGLSAASGEILWQARLRAGLNACPAVVDDLLVVGAGIRLPGGPAAPELVAFGLRD